MDLEICKCCWREERHKPHWVRSHHSKLNWGFRLTCTHMLKSTGMLCREYNLVSLALPRVLSESFTQRSRRSETLWLFDCGLDAHTQWRGERKFRRMICLCGRGVSDQLLKHVISWKNARFLKKCKGYTLYKKFRQIGQIINYFLFNFSTPSLIKHSVLKTLTPVLVVTFG